MARSETVVLTNMCMLKNERGEYLVEDRVDPWWSGIVFPGGHVEAKETFRDSVIREVFEETGITVEDPRLVGVKQFTDNDKHRYIVFLYTATRWHGSLVSSREGEALWLTEEEIRQRKTVPGFYDMYRALTDDEVSELYYTEDGSALFL